MIKKTALFITATLSFHFILSSPVLANSRLQAIKEGTVEATNPSLKESAPAAVVDENAIIEPDDIVYLGSFQTYSPKIRKNLDMAVYAEPSKFAYATRACINIIKIRDRINAYFYSNPLEIIEKNTVNTDGFDAGIRSAVKEALKTKREYFVSYYVVSGNYNDYKKPDDLKEISIVTCDKVISQANELAKAAAKAK
jgi:hypothetical protein